MIFFHSQEITKRAIAESGIRQALMDLEIWENTASLPVQESTDSKNMTILLVGDYGNLLAKIGTFIYTDLRVLCNLSSLKIEFLK